ncbi:MAG TPA: ADP-ribosylglycohydrolase family protein [Gemmatimonadales bacterium]|nr:ADP-ribosylglycohydrolase family protein [Gemmatimonadales bacterium]
MPDPLLVQRARGALLGHAAGNALGVATEFIGTPDAIRSRFPTELRDVIRQDTPESPYDDDLALSLILCEELLEPDIDLHRLAHKWAEWADRDGRGLGEWSLRALRHIKTHDAPPASTGGHAGNGSVSRCLPIALRMAGSLPNLVSGSYHIAMLTHPDERCAWGAVAVNLAAASFLSGRRDFIGEVLEVLRNNDAPQELRDAVGRVPLERREDLPINGPSAGYVIHAVEIGLWFAYHEPDLERGIIWLANAGGDTDTNAAVAGGLMGARDGDKAVPARWLNAIPDVARIRSLAERLVGAE